MDEVGKAANEGMTDGELAHHIAHHTREQSVMVPALIELQTLRAERQHAGVVLHYNEQLNVMLARLRKREQEAATIIADKMVQYNGDDGETVCNWCGGAGNGQLTFFEIYHAEDCDAAHWLALREVP